MLALLIAASVSFVEDSRLPEEPVAIAPAPDGGLFLLARGAREQLLFHRDAAGGVQALGSAPAQLAAIAIDDDGVTLWGATTDAVHRRAPDGTWSSHALVRAGFDSHSVDIVALGAGRVAIAFQREGLVVATASEVRTRPVPGLASVVPDGAGGVWATTTRWLGDHHCLASIIHQDEAGWRVFGDPLEGFAPPEPLPAELAPETCSDATVLFRAPGGVWLGGRWPVVGLAPSARGLAVTPLPPRAGAGAFVSVSSSEGVMVDRNGIDVDGLTLGKSEVSGVQLLGNRAEVALGNVDISMKSAGGRVWVLFVRPLVGSISIGAAGAVGLFSAGGGLSVLGHPRALARLQWAERRRAKNVREDAETASPYRWGWGIAGALVGLSAGTVATAKLANAGWGGAAAQIGVDGLVGAFPIGLTMWAADEWLHTPEGEPAFLSAPGTILGTIVTLAVVPAVTAGTGILVDPEGHGGYGGAVLGTIGGLLLSYGLHALFEEAPVRFQWMLAGMLTGSGATLGYRLARTH